MNRHSYPFVTADGKPSPITPVITHMAIYCSPDTKLPIFISDCQAYERGDGMAAGVKITFSAQDGTVIGSASNNGDNHGAIVSPRGERVGWTTWNTTAAEALRGMITGGMVIPDRTVMVIPDLCIPVEFTGVSAVTINGEPASGDIVIRDLGYTTLEGYRIDPLPLPRNPEDYPNLDQSQPLPVNSVVLQNIVSTSVHDGVAEEFTLVEPGDEFEGDLYVSSDPTCDLCVFVDGDTLIFKEYCGDYEQGEYIPVPVNFVETVN